MHMSFLSDLVLLYLVFFSWLLLCLCIFTMFSTLVFLPPAMQIHAGVLSEFPPHRGDEEEGCVFGSWRGVVLRVRVARWSWLVTAIALQKILVYFSILQPYLFPCSLNAEPYAPAQGQDQWRKGLLFEPAGDPCQALSSATLVWKYSAMFRHIFCMIVQLWTSQETTFSECMLSFSFCARHTSDAERISTTMRRSTG